MNGDPNFNPQRHHDALTEALGKKEHGGRLRTYSHDIGVKKIYGAAPRGPVHEKCVPKTQYDDIYQKWSQYESQYGTQSNEAEAGTQFGTGTQSQPDAHFEMGQQFESYGLMTQALLSMDPGATAYPYPYSGQQPVVYPTEPSPVVFSTDPPPTIPTQPEVHLFSIIFIINWYLISALLTLQFIFC